MTYPLSRRRAGLGAPFFVVISVLVILSLYAISMSVRSQGVSRSARKAQYVETCRVMAEKAIEELTFRGRGWANLPGHPLYLALRNPAGDAEVSVAPKALGFFAAELARLPSYRLDALSLRVLRRAPTSLDPALATPYETMGFLELRAQVSGPESSEVSYATEHGFRTVLSTIPRPYDAMTFYLHEADPLVTAGAVGGDPNETMRWAIQRIGEMRKGLEDMLAKLPAAEAAVQAALRKAESAEPFDGGAADKARAAADALSEVHRDLRAALSPAEWPVKTPWKLSPAGTDTDAEEGELHEFSFPLSVYSLAPELRLAEVFLPAKVQPGISAYLGRAETRKQTVAAAAAAEKNASDDPTGLVEPLKALFDMTRLDVAELHGVLLAYKLFQVAMVEVAGKVRGEYVVRAGRWTPDEVRARATLVYEGTDAAARAAAALSRKPAPTGLVYVDDPGAPLTVAISAQTGRLVVYSRGDVEVVQARVKDPAVDALAVIGGAKLRVLDSAPQAALQAVGDGYEGEGRDFEGALVLERFRDLAHAAEVLRGTIRRLETAASGPPGDPRPPPDRSRIHAVLAPYPVVRRSGV